MSKNKTLGQIAYENSAADTSAPLTTPWESLTKDTQARWEKSAKAVTLASAYGTSYGMAPEVPACQCYGCKTVAEEAEQAAKAQTKSPGQTLPKFVTTARATAPAYAGQEVESDQFRIQVLLPFVKRFLAKTGWASDEGIKGNAEYIANDLMAYDPETVKDMGGDKRYISPKAIKIYLSSIAAAGYPIGADDKWILSIGRLSCPNQPKPVAKAPKTPEKPPGQVTYEAGYCSINPGAPAWVNLTVEEQKWWEYESILADARTMQAECASIWADTRTKQARIMGEMFDKAKKTYATPAPKAPGQATYELRKGPLAEPWDSRPAYFQAAWAVREARGPMEPREFAENMRSHFWRGVVKPFVARYLRSNNISTVLTTTETLAELLSQDPESLAAIKGHTETLNPINIASILRSLTKHRDYPKFWRFSCIENSDVTCEAV